MVHGSYVSNTFEHIFVSHAKRRCVKQKLKKASAFESY